MSKKMKKIIAAVISITFVLSSVGIVYAADTHEKTDTAENTVSISAENTINTSSSGKDETVYVFAGADGSTNKIIVSDWLKNPDGENSLKDFSELKNIENVKGDETFSLSGKEVTWNADGNDIYYQGEISKELPISMNIKYTLDGKEVSPKELAGKSGHVVIRYEYTNNQLEKVELNGKEQEVYVPFAVLTGMVLDNDIFKNVEVTNGKLINDGNRSAVVGMAFPSLQENLKIDKDKFEIPDYFEVSADVKNFSLTNTVTLATNEVFNNISFSKSDELSNLSDSMTKLSDAMTQLMDSSSKLYDGLDSLLTKSNELVSGINSLSAGSDKLKNGVQSLSSGANTLSDGTKSLYSGLSELQSNSAELNAGAEQVFESLLSMAADQLNQAGLEVPELTISNYQTVLNSVLAGLNEDTVTTQAKAKVTAAVNAQRSAVEAKVTEAVRAEVLGKVLASMNMTLEQYQQGVAAGVITSAQQAQINGAVDAQMSTDSVKAVISSKTDEQINMLIEQNMQSADVQAQISQGIDSVNAGRNSITALIDQLNSYNEFYTGLSAYTSGVDSAKAGAEKLNTGAASLSSGAKDLSAGINELNNGIKKIKDNTPALIDGVKQLRDGAKSLNEGIVKLNNDGITKLINAVDGNFSGLFERVDYTLQASEKYRSFSGITDDTNGTVKFVYRTEAIK